MVDQNKYGVNKLLRYKVLSNDEMRKLGFTDCRKDYWYKYIPINDKYNISFNITIPKNGKDDLKIDILDEDFCQPYDYQYFLQVNPEHQLSLDVKQKVENVMKQLQIDHIISGFYEGMYI